MTPHATHTQEPLTIEQKADAFLTLATHGDCPEWVQRAATEIAHRPTKPDPAVNAHAGLVEAGKAILIALDERVHITQVMGKPLEMPSIN